MINRIKGLLSVVIGVFVLAGFTGCGESIVDSEAGNTSVVNSSVLIQLPSSIAPSDNIALAKSSQSGQDLAEEFYNDIRLWTGIANELVNGDTLSVRWIIETLISDIDWDYVKEVQSLTAEDLEDSLLFIIEYQSSSEQPYMMTVKDMRQEGEPVVIYASFNGSESSPQGRVYYFIDEENTFTHDSLTIDVHFSKMDGTRNLTIDITQSLPQDVTDEPQKLQYALREENGIVHISGSNFYPYTDFHTAPGHCYTYTAVVDTALNIAKVNLGLPHADYTDTELIFTDYGIEKVFGNWFIDTEIQNLSDTEKSFLVTSYQEALTLEEIFVKMYADSVLTLTADTLMEDASTEAIEYYISNVIPELPLELKIVIATSVQHSLTVEEIAIGYLEDNPTVALPPNEFTVEYIQDFIDQNQSAIADPFSLHDPSGIAEMDVDDLMLFLDLNKDISDDEFRAEIEDLLWILKLNQPVYFGYNGYAGNGETAPEGFETIELLEYQIAPYVPSEVKALEITLD